ncbi:unnamed protein product, partial [Closterium sp. NIES-64]
AMADLSRSLHLDPTNQEALLHRGTLHFHAHDYWAAIRDFSTLLDARPPDPLLFNALGLALAGAGEWRRAAEVFERGAALFPRAVQLWLEGGRAFKELGAVQPALHALERAVALEESTVAYHRLASLHQLTGDHRAAMESAQRGLRGNPGDIELNHAVASALHALGDFPSALRQYDHVLSLSAGDTPGAFHVLQFMAFYQREIAAYTVLRLDAPFTAFHLDHHLDVNFREAWVKKLSPWTLFPAYQPIRLTQPILSAASQASLPSLSKQALVLIGEADSMGQRTQYHVDGFFPNQRQVCRHAMPCHGAAGASLRAVGEANRAHDEGAWSGGIESNWKDKVLTCNDGYRHVPSFLPSTSCCLSDTLIQYRMAGLAMLDIMQRVASTWHAMASATSSQHNSGSHDATSSHEAMCSPAAALDSEAAAPPAAPDSPSPSMPPAAPTAPTAATAPDSAVAGSSHKGSPSNRGTGEQGRRRRGRGGNSKSKGRGQGGELIGGWREVFDRIVRWRQIAEPTDTVAWIDALK